MPPKQCPPAPRKGRAPSKSNSQSSGLMPFFENNPDYVLAPAPATNESDGGAVGGRPITYGEPEVSSRRMRTPTPSPSPSSS